jgi:hypothetical protein
VAASSSLRTVLAFAAILYLCAAGWFFILAPWSRFWASDVVPRGPFWLIPWLDSPAVRGALSAFGALHFVAALSWLSSEAHDQ